MQLIVSARVWAHYKENRGKQYSKDVYAFAERWADKMEEQMHQGKNIPDSALQTSIEADTCDITKDLCLITIAVGILNKVWVHGNRLAKWHRSESLEIAAWIKSRWSMDIGIKADKPEAKEPTPKSFLIVPPLWAEGTAPQEEESETKGMQAQERVREHFRDNP